MIHWINNHPWTSFALFLPVFWFLSSLFIVLCAYGIAGCNIPWAKR